MPIYEYRCEGCATTFEQLVRSSAQVIRCPRCEATSVSRQLSSFAAHGVASRTAGAGSSKASGCGGCSGGSCSGCH